MTILFAKDWSKYPRAIIHYETKNHSFLKLANTYHRMGVKNCAFMLALVNPELKHVDPHDPNLTPREKELVVAECSVNFWYYLREFVRVPVPGSLEPVCFKADRANIALYWLFFNHMTTLITIIRQTGKTTMLMVLVSWLLNIGSKNSFINLLTKNDTLRTETLQKLKELFEEMPDYGDFRSKGDVFNSEEANVSVFKNKFRGNLSSSSPKMAEKVGRGFTTAINLIDEVAFVENIAIAMGAMLMAGNAARRYAREMNRPYGTVLATTAGDIDDRDGGYIYELSNSATRMSEIFFDSKDETELWDTVAKNSRSRGDKSKRPMVLIDYSYRQLGYTDAWLKQQLDDNISTPDNIKRDLFGIWLSGSSSSPLPKDLVETLKKSLDKEPIKYLFAPHGFMINMYVDHDRLAQMERDGDSIIVGIDTSDGIGKDDIAFIARNHYTGEIVLTAIFNEINLIYLADFFVAFLVKYKNSFIIMERKSSAPTIIDYMVTKLVAHGINPFKRMYNTIIQDREIHTEEYDNVMSGRVLNNETLLKKYSSHIGFKTSGGGVTARSALYSTTLMQMLKYTAHNTRFEELIDQISHLVLRNNRIDHPKGGSDDAVIASLLSFWVLINGKNLKDYGINATRILKSNEVYLSDKYQMDLDLIDKEEMQRKEEAFDDLLDEYRRERNPIISRKLEGRIRLMASELSTSSNVISVEELFDSIRRGRRFRNRS